MPPKTESEKILSKFDKSKRDRIIAYFNTMKTEEQELYFLNLPELEQNKLLVEFEAEQANTGDEKIRPETIDNYFRYAKIEDFEEDDFSDATPEEEFNISQNFHDLENSILPIDYLLENKDRYFIKEILENALFVTTQKKFERFYFEVCKIDEELSEDGQIEDEKSNLLLFYLSDKVVPDETLFQAHAELKELKISQMFIRLRQLIGPINASKYFYVQVVSPKCQFMVNCGIFMAKVDTFNTPLDFTQIYVRDYYELQQQNELVKIKPLEVSPYLISLTYLTEEVESLFDLKGFEDYRSDFPEERIKEVQFRLFYFKKQKRVPAIEEKIVTLEEELQSLKYEENKRDDERKQIECKFLTVSDDIICTRWATDLLRQRTAKLEATPPELLEKKEMTFFMLKPGMKCEFNNDGEVYHEDALLGLKNSEWHRCDQFNGGITYCGTEWRGEKIIFKFV